MSKKKQEEQNNQEDYYVQPEDFTPTVEAAQQQPQVEEKPVKVKLQVENKTKDNWEIKDRLYVLANGKKPLSKSIRASNIFWFDEEKGYERELKLTSNQRTVFVDEMKGDQRLEHIVFRNGTLFVPKNKVVLQKLLSLYHPHRNILFEEVNKVKEAATDLDILEMQLDAMNLATALDIDVAEAVMRVEVGSEVSTMSSKELRRDLMLFAKNNPALFIELASDDNVQLRNIGVKAAEQGIITLSQDQRHFNWSSTGRKLMTIPFDENPYSALAAWFKTDEGVEVFSSIEKRLK
jgi:hypothetical protein